MPDTFHIGCHRIGSGHKAFIIAEVAQNHDGSLGQAHAFIDAAAAAGADAVKFQTHIAEAETTMAEPFRVPFSYADSSRYAYWKRMEFTREQWASLAAHARERGLVFLSSPFSLEAFRLLDELGVPAWKVASGEVNNLPLLRAMAATEKPVLLSTGMSDREEIRAAVQEVRKKGASLAVFQTTSLYPVPLAKVGMNMLETFRSEFGCPVGLSDHSGTVYPSLAALALGANLVEVHVTFHRSMFGPDAPSSLTFDELRLIADAARAFHEMSSNPVDKDVMARELADMRALFTKSVAPIRDLEAGTVLQESMLTLKKPGTGIPASDLPRLVGRRLRKPVSPMRLIMWDDLEDVL
jgi:N-acetylneuraminate synthase